MANLSLYTQKIRERLRVSELIGRDLKLTRKGNEFSGLCPFHHEKTPSFTVNDHKGFYHCFGCGAHGDVINYAMERQNLDFQTAVKELASLLGIKIEETSNSPTSPPELYQILEFSCQWFEENLKRSIGEIARDYLQKRGFLKETQEHFRLGFAPDPKQTNQSLLQALEKKGFSKDLILKSGIIVQTDDRSRIYDRFRNRLIFPIQDAKGQVIAFGGRILEANSNADKAKYLNSAETELFHKGHILYNQYYAFKHTDNDHPPLVVEGYFDVIALHQAGWRTAVAPLGTALTDAQLNLLWRRHSYPVLCFDGDNAGWAASFKAVKKALPFLQSDKSLKVCYLPKGEDPDSLIRSQGSESFKKVINSLFNLVDSLWNSLLRLNPSETLQTPEKKAHFKEEALNLIKTIENTEVRRFYEQDFFNRLKKILYESTYVPSSKKKRDSTKSNSVSIESPKSKNKKYDLAHKILLAILITHPILLNEVFEQFAALDFQEEAWHNLRLCMLENSYEEFDKFKERVDQAGFKIVIEELFDRELILHAPFAMPGSDPQTALERWKEIWHHTLWKQQIKNDLKQAQDLTKQSLDHKTWEKLKVLKSTIVS